MYITNNEEVTTMANENKELNLDELDSVAGGDILDLFKDYGWDGKCPSCKGDIYWSSSYGNYCSKCGLVIDTDYLRSIYLQPGEALV